MFSRDGLTRPHWRTPALMVSALLVGIALAAGHHSFYASLHSTAVSSADWNIAGWRANQQQVNVTVGTALAFGVKASLILAASTAYMQLFFRAINTKDFQMATLDNWYGALGDLPSLFCISTYWRYPVLTLVALTAWLLPIAAVISPASLSVTYDRITPAPIQPTFAPQPAFESLAFSLYGVSNKTDGTYSVTWGGSANEVMRISYAVATSGVILPIESPGTNATWHQTLEAPRLSCGDVNTTARTKIFNNMITAYSTWTNITNHHFQYAMINYLAWEVPSNRSTPVPFLKDYVDGSYYLSGKAMLNVEPNDLYFGIFPRARSLFPNKNGTSDDLNYWVGASTPQEAMSWYWGDSTFLRCQVIPSKYRLQFTYSGSGQDQYLKILGIEDAPIDYMDDLSVVFQAPFPGGPLNVSVYDDREQGDVPRISHQASMAMRKMSYLSIQTAIKSFLLGGAQARFAALGTADLTGRQGEGLQLQTQVFSTILANTDELLPIQKLSRYGQSSAQNDAYYLTNFTSGRAFDQATSLLPAGRLQYRGSLKSTLEELYFNITMSMASSSLLKYNSTSPLAPPEVNVTYNIYGNIYEYSSDKLWLAYGLAISVSFFNIFAGLWAIIRTGASHSPNFSTIVRMARNAGLEADAREHRMPGKDPLPKHLAKAELQLPKQGGARDIEAKHSQVFAKQAKTSSETQLAQPAQDPRRSHDSNETCRGSDGR